MAVSSVDSQLKHKFLWVDDVLDDVQRAERRLWQENSVLDTSGSVRDSRDGEIEDVGTQIASHGKHMERLHGYFRNLEPRRYCLSLRFKPTRHYTSIVRVGSNTAGRQNGLQGAMITGSLEEDLSDEPLEDLKFEVYKGALLCAQYPILYPFINSASYTSLHSPRTSPLPRRHSAGRQSPPDFLGDYWEKEKLNILPSCLTPPEETLNVSRDSLTTLVRQIFQLSHTAHVHHQIRVRDSIHTNDPKKLLIQELRQQLATLDHNHHPFYRPPVFLDKDAYSKWLLSEKKRITCLINWLTLTDFATTPLSTAVPLHLTDKNLLYRDLFSLTMKWENSQRSEFVLSAESNRLLKEYALRYGVSEMYRRLVHLEFLAEHFEPTLWCMQHARSLILHIMEVLSYYNVTLVKQECTMLSNIAKLLYGHVENALTRIKRLFPENQPSCALLHLTDLLDAVLSVKEYFTKNLRKRSTKDWIKLYLLEGMKLSYERFKIIATDQLNAHSHEDIVTPKLLYIVLSDVREEVTYYQTHYKQDLSRYVDIGQFAAQEFYKLLMADIEMMSTSLQRLKEDEIDLRMLSLAYRLSQLDQNWVQYIPTNMQTWRLLFSTQACTWLQSLQYHLNTVTQLVIEGDEWKPLSVTVSKEVDQPSGSNTARTGPKQGQGPIPNGNLTASQNSAFENVSSSFGLKTGQLMGSRDGLDNKQSRTAKTSEDNQEGLTIRSGARPIHNNTHFSKSPTISFKSIGDVSNSNLSSFHSISTSSEQPHSPATGIKEEAPQDDHDDDGDFQTIISDTDTLGAYSSYEGEGENLGRAERNENWSETEDQLLPVSMSLVDVLTTVNRMTNFVCHLCKLIFLDEGIPERPTVVDLQTETILMATLKQRLVMARKELYGQFSEVIFHTFTLYAHCQLFIDTCGVEDLVSVIGNDLKNALCNEFRLKNLCGCKHLIPQTDMHENTIINYCANWLSIQGLMIDRVPPAIEMCLRINNVGNLAKIVPRMAEQMAAAIMDPDSFLLAEDISGSYCMHGPSTSNADNPPEQPGTSVSKEKIEEMLNRFIISQHTQRLLQIQHGQVKILAYKVHEIFEKLFIFLCELDLPNYSTKKRLLPALSFLDTEIKILQSSLYPQTFTTALQEIWTNIMKGFEKEFLDLQHSVAEDSGEKALLLIEAIMLLNPLFYNSQFKLDLNFLSVTMRPVLQDLHLYTLSTESLIHKYNNKDEILDIGYWEDPLSSISSNNTMQTPSGKLLQNILEDMHRHRKCFSGQDLLRWMHSNLHRYNDEDFGDCLGDTPAAITIRLGNYLLKRTFIKSLTPACASPSVSSTSSSSRTQYDSDGNEIFCVPKTEIQTVNELTATIRDRSGGHRRHRQDSDLRRQVMTMGMTSDDTDNETVSSDLDKSLHYSDEQFCTRSNMLYMFTCTDDALNPKQFATRQGIGEKILYVLFSRYRTDSKAKEFLNGIPSNDLETLEFQDSVTCSLCNWQ